MEKKVTRRNLVRGLVAMPIAWAVLALKPIKAMAGEWPQALFNAPTSQAALGLLQAGTALPGPRILLDVAEIVEDGDRVVVRVMSTLPSTDQITLLADTELKPVLAQFNISPDLEPDITTHIRLSGTGTLRAVVRAGGKIYSVTKEVKVAEMPWTSSTPRSKRKKADPS